MGGIVLGILVWQEGGESVAAILAIGAIAMAGLVFWLKRRKREGKPTLIDPDLFTHKPFRLGISQQMLQQITLGGTMIALPIYLQMVLEYDAMQAGPLPRAALAEHVRIALLAGRRPGTRRPSSIIRLGIRASHGRECAADPDRAAGRLRLVPPALAGDRGNGVGLCWSPSSTTTRWRRSPRSGSARPPA